MVTHEHAIAHAMLESIPRTLLPRFIARSLTDSLGFTVTEDDVRNAFTYLGQRLEARVTGETLSDIERRLERIEHTVNTIERMVDDGTGPD